jgi:hypothetical protein
VSLCNCEEEADGAVTLVARGGVEAARGGGVGGGGAGVGGRRSGLAREAGFLGRDGCGGRWGRAGSAAGELQALPASCGGHPGAPDVGLAVEAAAVAAGAAAVVRAPLLRLVAAVVARRRAGPGAGPAAAPVQHGEGLLAGGAVRCSRLRLRVPELDGARGRRGRLPGGGVGVDEGALRRGDEREHGVVGGRRSHSRRRRGSRPLVVERSRGSDDEHPDVTGGAYCPVSERGGGGGGLARRRGAPEPGRQRRAGPAGIEAQREVVPAAAGGRRQPARDRRGVRREAPPRRRRHACLLSRRS